MLINKSIYFVHIPRTGGRYVKELIKFNNHICILGDYVQWNNKEVSHLCFLLSSCSAFPKTTPCP